MQLDIPTVVCAASVVFAAQAVAVFVQYKVDKASPGLGWWLAGAVLQALGFLFMLALLSPALAVLAMFANPLVFLGQVSLSVGIAEFLGLDGGRRRRLYAPPAALCLAAYYYFVFARNSTLGRAVVIFGSTAAAALATACLLVRGRRRRFSSSAGFTALVFLLFGCLQAALALANLLLPPLESYGDIGSSPIRTAAFIAPIVGSILWTFGFIVMVNQRLNAENLEEKEKLRLVFEIGPEAMLIARLRDGLLADANEGFLEMTGHARRDAIGAPILELGIWARAEDALAFLAELRGSGGRIDKREGRFLRKDGSPFLGAVSGRVLSIDDEEHVVVAIDDITERKRAEEAIRHMATHDELTDLPSLRLYRDRLSMAMSLSRRSRSSAAAMFLDLDGFKAVNDGYGHDAGDAVLREVARRLRSALRETDTVARGGGDEFLLAIADLRRPEDAADMARKLLAALSPPVIYGGASLSIGASIGIAIFPRDGEEVDRLIKLADEAMYEVKSSGKNGYGFAGGRAAGP
ncbi:MAG TPA: sensor domain-containing diguanylate cyclase [Spirochaetales bacterium]|nr:sensor domain-containing diguanylate cyclase [Spirochaetales bacterium]